ncbi:MAG: hypothetical protein RMJ98_00470 [Myxococcales bacterium]|nr:hypothetical protein [Polyangiaceae bacterium]MDW8247760.1 hypothetical protein [Myxococcales bacterium]
MHTPFKTFLLAMAFLSLSANEARAHGAVVHASRLPPAARASLAADVAKARKANPEIFRAVEQIADRLAELDANRRGRYAPITPLLKRLGPKALLPMLERAALQSPPRGNLSDTAWRGWRIALIEASSMIRDARSLPLYLAVLDSDETDFDVLRVTSEAISRLGDETALQKLIALAKQPGPRQRPLLAGLGEARRLSAAQTLADASRGVFGPLDDETARFVAKALGEVGSAWVWKMPTTPHKSEEAAIRALAAKALVDLFVARPGEPRSSATAALLMVDDPSTPQLIEQARQGASPQLQQALDELAQRFAKNPLR